jgi:hypothetical protein
MAAWCRVPLTTGLSERPAHRARTRRAPCTTRVADPRLAPVRLAGSRLPSGLPALAPVRLAALASRPAGVSAHDDRRRPLAGPDRTVAGFPARRASRPASETAGRAPVRPPSGRGQNGGRGHNARARHERRTANPARTGRERQTRPAQRAWPERRTQPERRTRHARGANGARALNGARAPNAGPGTNACCARIERIGARQRPCSRGVASPRRRALPPGRRQYPSRTLFMARTYTASRSQRRRLRPDPVARRHRRAGWAVEVPGKGARPRRRSQTGVR